MRGDITITEEDARNIDPVAQKTQDLIRRFNDPNYEHVQGRVPGDIRAWPWEVSGEWEVKKELPGLHQQLG